MKIEVPSELGAFDDRLIDGRNIILARDNHVSSEAHQNIARLYNHLADSYGLRLVSFEGSAQDHHKPSAPEKIKSRVIPKIIEVYSQEPLRGLVQIIADRRGFELNQVRSGLDAKLAPAWFFSGIAETIAQFHPEYLADDEIAQIPTETFLDLTLDLLEPYRLLFPDLDERLNPLSPLEACNLLGELISRERTRQHLLALALEMRNLNISLSMAIRGFGHLDEFKELTRQYNVGYGVFDPLGRDIIDEELLDRYRKQHARILSQEARKVLEAKNDLPNSVSSFDSKLS